MNMPLHQNTSLVNLENITPCLAKTLLDKSRDARFIQRSLNRSNIALFAREMKAGRWKTTPTELIGISPLGYVFQGQHRLEAVIMADITVPMYVVYNANPDSFDVIDRGGIRSDIQVARLAGYDKGSKEFGAIHQAFQNPDDKFSRKAKIVSGYDTVSLCQFFEKESQVIFRRFPGSQTYTYQNYRAALIRACKVYPTKVNLIYDFLKLSMVAERSVTESGVMSDNQVNLGLYMNQHLSRCGDNKDLSRFVLYQYTLKAIYCVMKDKKYSSYRTFLASPPAPRGFFQIDTDEMFGKTIDEAVKDSNMK